MAKLDTYVGIRGGKLFTFINKLTAAASSKKGAKWTVLIWILLAIAVSGLSSGAKDYATSINNTGLPDDAESMVAENKLQIHFKGEIGVPAILVFHNENGLTDQDLKQIDGINEKLETASLTGVKEVIPVYEFSEELKSTFISKNKTTFILPVNLKDGLERKVINTTIKDINSIANKELKENKDLELKITGPAGIVSDMIAIFASADLVLLLGTVGLIFVILIVIYRSPIIALVPLLGAGLIYQVVDRVIGMFGKNGMGIESQSVSIMSILLLAVITDYALFIVSRFREELRLHEDKHKAMTLAMEKVSEPIFFSGTTVIAAMLVLFAAVFEPYRNFAPVFSIALVFILLGGLTLLPALFVLFGRKSFWPYIPKLGSAEKMKPGFWDKLAATVTKRPIISGSVVAILLIIVSLNVTTNEYSFNLIKSFPEDMESRQGFEVLEKNFAPGELAMTTVIVEGKDKLNVEHLANLRKEILAKEGVENVTPDLSNPDIAAFGKGFWLTDDEKTAKLSIVFTGNPYDVETMDHLNVLRDNDEKLLSKAGFEQTSLYFAGETAKQADTRAVNDRDTVVVVIAITLLITILLGFQSQSLIAPIYMMATIILSYFAALGFSIFMFKNVFNYDAMSYRIPLYSFIFLVALGVDYNIMLISRIKEEAKKHPIKKAVELGLARTGGVISSAGIILAATFAVLMTQPILELFMFGFTVAVGVLIDTFLVRTILVPALMVKLDKWALWPQKVTSSK
ncbi:MMPL family transporter [Sporosarcina limicola]|uniref:RND superfamily putative drug exporter n=1 Tax=Sporosarcina limicola TaxID=34101 RepID=A0A927RDP4_9BACL|nr:MMPL family transporter [Sporosarcina limicola]MBE1555525.1 RND superfamily putative drug exporter [Sporosarcina limicola]